MQKNKTIYVISILVLVFLSSVLVRYPNIDRPLSKHHEFVTAIPLRVLQIWHAEGAIKYNFNPVMNYPGEANKYINNNASTSKNMLDRAGNYYYVSHPPFAYIFPYVVFELLQIKPTNLSLQVFHLVINFFSAVFIYLIVCLLSIQKPFQKLFIPGLIAFGVYIFSPAVLWFQCNTYMSDMLVHFPFVLAVYTILKLLMREKFYSTKYLLYYALFLFLMIYTSWLGLFFALSVFLYSIIKLRYQKVFIPLVFITIFVSLASLILITKQYSSINGLEAYIIQMLNRLGERGSFQGGYSFGFFVRKLFELKTLIFTYVTSYLPIFILLLTFIFLTIKKAKMGLVFTKNGYRFLWLSTLPVLMLHFFLLNYSGHDFVSLYGSLFLAVVVGILYDKLKKSKSFSPYTLNGGVLAVIFSSIAIYYFINKPGDYSWNKDYYATSKEIGTFIKNNAKPDEKIFIDGNITLDPQLIYYAERNIIKLNNNYSQGNPKVLKFVTYAVKTNGEIEIKRH
ncbi:MAG: hypothetical protein ACPG4Y_03330 [Chitinophagales bacterium]